MRIRIFCIPTSPIGRRMLSHFILRFHHLVVGKRMCVKFCFQIKTKILKKRLLLVQVAELTAFQRSKVLDVDDETYPIISCYRYFSLKRHKTNRHSSELVSESIQMKLCCFFFLDIFFMRDLNLLSWTQSKTQTVEK